MSSFAYRPEIDGLRAVAVLPVIAFHAGVPGFAGGFVGVDVFFVISGYLITTILLREQAAGGISLVRFYERRARRILPALFVVIGASLPFAMMWMLPDALAAFGRSIGATMLFASNILFWSEAGYFAAAAEELPLLHTWSLAVEEQFYLIFPPLLMLLWRFGTKALWVVFTGLAVVSALTALAATRDTAFYWAPYRAWELLAGVLAAITLWNGRWLPKSDGFLASFLALAALALLVTGMVWVDLHEVNSVKALPPAVLAATIIILCARDGNLPARLLSWRPTVAIGLISYSVYLWHQPLLAFTRIRSIDPVHWTILLPIALLSLPLAWISWRFVEQPARRAAYVSVKAVWVGAALGMTLLICIGAVLHLSDGWPSRFEPRVLEQARAATLDHNVSVACARVSYPVEGACVSDLDASHALILWGDSHAEMLYGPLVGLMEPLDRAVLQVTRSGCPPLLRDPDQFGAECANANTKTLEALLNAPAPQTILIAARWAWYFDPRPFDDGEGGPQSDVPSLLQGPAPDVAQLPDWIAAISRDMSVAVKLLAEAGHHVSILNNVPELGHEVRRTLARRLAYNGDEGMPISVAQAHYHSRIAPALAAFEPVAQLYDTVNMLNPEPVFCRIAVGTDVSRCYARGSDGAVLYFDEDHLDLEGAARLSNWITGQVPLVPTAPLYQ